MQEPRERAHGPRWPKAPRIALVGTLAGAGSAGFLSSAPTPTVQWARGVILGCSATSCCWPEERGNGHCFRRVWWSPGPERTGSYVPRVLCLRSVRSSAQLSVFWSVHRAVQPPRHERPEGPVTPKESHAHPHPLPLSPWQRLIHFRLYGSDKDNFVKRNSPGLERRV